MSFCHLCSHLVRIQIEGAQQAAQLGNLEQIDAFEALVVLEEPLPTQVEVHLQAEGISVPAYVELCRRRQTDFEAVLIFRDGFQWSPEVWKPDHLYRLENKAKGAAGAH